MASNATITVNDGASTPVAHSFDPVRIEGDVARYQNKVAAAILGRETMNMRLSASPKVRSAAIDLRVPYLVSEVINGVTVYKVQSFAQIKSQILIPLDWTPAQAKNVRVLGANLLLHATIGLMVDEQEFVW